MLSPKFLAKLQAAGDDVTLGTKLFKLLTPGNPKTEKGRGKGYITFILHLAPAALSGFQVCPMATAGCRAACLNTAGRGGIMAGVSGLTYAMVAAGTVNAIQAARIRRTRRFFEDRQGFMTDLVADIRKALEIAAALGMVAVFRLNGTSDIRWENVGIASEMGRNVFSVFPDVQFYDYTKIANRRRIPANYDLTFSYADGNAADAAMALEAGRRVAVVFRDKATVARYEASGFMATRVVNGDASDLRFLEPTGVVVALYAKGQAVKDVSGFVVD